MATITIPKGTRVDLYGYIVELLVDTEFDCPSEVEELGLEVIKNRFGKMFIYKDGKVTYLS